MFLKLQSKIVHKLTDAVKPITSRPSVSGLFNHVELKFNKNTILVIASSGDVNIKYATLADENYPDFEFILHRDTLEKLSQIAKDVDEITLDIMTTEEKDGKLGGNPNRMLVKAGTSEFEFPLIDSETLSFLKETNIILSENIEKVGKVKAKDMLKLCRNDLMFMCSKKELRKAMIISYFNLEDEKLTSFSYSDFSFVETSSEASVYRDTVFLLLHSNVKEIATMLKKYDGSNVDLNIYIGNYKGNHKTVLGITTEDENTHMIVSSFDKSYLKETGYPKMEEVLEVHKPKTFVEVSKCELFDILRQAQIIKDSSDPVALISFDIEDDNIKIESTSGLQKYETTLKNIRNNIEGKARIKTNASSFLKILQASEDEEMIMHIADTNTTGLPLYYSDSDGSFRILMALVSEK